MRSLRWLLLPAVLGAVTGTAGAVQLSSLRPVAATASSVADGREPSRAVDGLVTEESTWISAPGAGPAWLEVRFPAPTTLAGVHVFTGFDPTTVIRDLVVQFWRDGAWVDVPSARISGNQRLADISVDLCILPSDRNLYLLAHSLCRLMRGQQDTISHRLQAHPPHMNDGLLHAMQHRPLSVAVSGQLLYERVQRIAQGSGV